YRNVTGVQTCAFPILLIVIIELFLLKYVEINNVLPILINNNYVNNIFSGAIYYASSCGLLCMLLLSINKSKIKNTKKYNKTIILDRKSVEKGQKKNHE